jgi:hypothetical protein
MIIKFTKTDNNYAKAKENMDKRQAYPNTKTNTTNTIDDSNDVIERKKDMTFRVSNLMYNSKSYEELRENLYKEQMTIYFTEQTCGFIDLKSKFKYRLGTLKLQNEFVYFVDKLDNALKKSEDQRNKIKDFAIKLSKEILRDMKYFVTGKGLKEENYPRVTCTLKEEFIQKMRYVANAIRQHNLYIKAQQETKKQQEESQKLEAKNLAYREELIKNAERILEAQKNQCKAKAQTR